MANNSGSWCFGFMASKEQRMGLHGIRWSHVIIPKGVLDLSLFGQCYDFGIYLRPKYGLKE